jgi:DNA-binding NarL/FixJ family response regulator
MAQSSPAQRRALIVEDEPVFAMGLAADMQALGFDTCDLAANRQDAFLQAMEDAPDIVLMDVNLEGGREGIEGGAVASRGMRHTCRLHYRIHRSRYC